MPIQMSRLTAAALVVALVASTPVIAHCQTVREWYALLQQSEQTARDLIASASAAESAQERDRILRRTRSVIASYESLARRHHASGYARRIADSRRVFIDASPLNTRPVHSSSESPAAIRLLPPNPQSRR